MPTIPPTGFLVILAIFAFQYFSAIYKVTLNFNGRGTSSLNCNKNLGFDVQVLF